MSDQELDVRSALPEEGWLSKFEEFLAKSWGSAVPAGFGEWLREKACPSQDSLIDFRNSRINFPVKFPMM